MTRYILVRLISVETGWDVQYGLRRVSGDGTGITELVMVLDRPLVFYGYRDAIDWVKDRPSKSSLEWEGNVF